MSLVSETNQWGMQPETETRRVERSWKESPWKCWISSLWSSC